MKEFLAKKEIEISFRRYAIDAMGMMTLGLFATLIIGLIFYEVGGLVGVEFLRQIGTWARGAMGFAIGVAVAYALKAPPLVIFAAAGVGFAGAYVGGIPSGVANNVAGSFIASLIAVEFGKIVSKETKIDIIVTPAVTILSGMAVAMLVGAPIRTFMEALGSLISTATDFVPLLMGLVVAVLMGMALTSPISSAAIAMMLGLDGIAAGAAVAGCAANMIGFAVASFRENKFGGLVSQGIGTSMLQLPNIMKNPLIWLPAIVASAVAGPLSALLGMENIPAGAGMGTSGLVGQFGTLTAMGYYPIVFLQIGLVHFLVPAAVALLVSEIMRKRGWIKFGDMKL